MGGRQKIASPVGRSVKEWIGKTPDSTPPPRVFARIFDRDKGICCLSGRKIRPGDKWEAHHKIALCENGENRESNLAPALIDPHKEETRRQRKLKKKIDSTHMKHIGAQPAPIRQLQNRGFGKSEKSVSRESRAKDRLPVSLRREGYIGCFKVGER